MRDRNAPVEEWVRKIARDEAEAGRADQLREFIGTVVENVYNRAPSGDYGRGDIRAWLLDELDKGRHA